MTRLLRSITNKIMATVLLITVFNSTVMADTDHISGDTSMTGSAVLAGVFAVLAFVVIFSNNKKTQ